jgi:precorrin-2 dehydrogenase / sirohydrochlorin ferrochelatase
VVIPSPDDADPAVRPDPEDPADRPGPDFPVVLDLAGRPCLVVGGGPVAARKVRALVEAGARVTVVAIDVVPAIDSVGVAGSAGVAVERRPYRSGEAAGFDLVVTATGDPSVDDAVVADARAAGVLVNRADRSRSGTVRLPAVLRRGPVTVAVSTGGTSPALSRWLRDRIASSLPAGLETVVGLMDEARTELQASGRSTESVAWNSLIEDRIVPLVEAGRIDEARAAIRAVWDGPA